jgi:pimeloyl-ACP methyl ester carboxylesterase
MMEYPGYSGDPEAPSQERILANALAAYDLVASQNPNLKIFAFGESLGTGPAAYLASRRPIQALVEQTPYPSINAIASADFPWLPVSFLNRSPFPAEIWAKNVKCPVLVLHGTDDEVIPYELGKQQAANFPNLAGMETFERAHHTDMPYRESVRFWSLIENFYKKALKNS